MAKEWYLLGSSNISGFEEGNFIGDRGGFSELINSFMGKTIQVFGDKPTNDPHEIRAIVQNVTADTPPSGSYRQVLAEIGSLQCGQLLQFDDRHWLVTSLVDNNRLYDKAVVWHCNFMLNFIPPSSEAIVTYPVVVHNATQYTSGVEEQRMMTVGATQRLIFLPYNDDTIDVDHDFRLLIDRRLAKPTAYRITHVDTEQFNYDGYGVLRWTVTEDVLRASDDVENMVADNTLTTSPGDGGGIGGGWL